ncbi:MAG: class I SAM-dependent DNA methyltransferase, partial [Marinobacter salsuginis]
RPSRRDKWWIFGEPCPKFRAALPPLSRYIATVKTAKHRTFQYVNSDTLPDSKLIACTLDQPEILGVLSSRVHTCWATAAGSALGVGNDPTYVKTKSFEAFSFPTLDEGAVAQIGKLATRVDAHRKDQLAEHPSLTLTGMYNVLEKLRASEELSDKEKTIHQQGLVSVLQELHDELDHAVFRAYGWSDLGEKLAGRPGATTPLPDKPADQAEAEEELLMRLVDLNKQRAEEESRGIVRWLRPKYQAPDAVQTAADITPKTATTKAEAGTTKGKILFPKALPDQLRVLREALAERSHTTESLAESFKRKPVKSVEEGLQSLVAVGVAGFDTNTQTWYSM